MHAAAVAAVLCVLLSACAAGTSQTPPGQTPSAQPGVRVIATGLQVPWGVAFLPDHSALVSERTTGRILQIPAGGGTPREVMHLSDVNTSSGEGGLLGLAVSPSYASDKLVYAYYTSRTDNRVVRFQLGGSVDVVLSGIARSSIHNGGRVAFGPDGMLYVTTGDAGTTSRSQDRGSLNGKILRLRPDGGIPSDNPFPGSRVYSLGHRNVEGLAWDSAGRLWATEFGANSRDEVNLIQPGHNYGWPEVEGTGDTQNGRFTNPVLTWPVAEASPSGAAIIGSNLYVGALRGQRLWRVPLDGKGGVRTPQALLTQEYGRLRTVVVAPDGSLWITTSNRDGRGSPTSDDDRIIRYVPASG
jgi:glucose/arabinose dehydrogenase